MLSASVCTAVTVFLCLSILVCFKVVWQLLCLCVLLWLPVCLPLSTLVCFKVVCQPLYLCVLLWLSNCPSSVYLYSSVSKLSANPCIWVYCCDCLSVFFLSTLVSLRVVCLPLFLCILQGLPTCLAASVCLHLSVSKTSCYTASLSSTVCLSTYICLHVSISKFSAYPCICVYRCDNLSVSTNVCLYLSVSKLSVYSCVCASLWLCLAVFARVFYLAS